jgi:acyl dehydratase
LDCFAENVESQPSSCAQGLPLQRLVAANFFQRAEQVGEEQVADNKLLRGRVTDEALELMRRRIGYPNQTVRNGTITEPWNVYATQDAFRRYAITSGDRNPLYCSKEYADASRWAAPLAPPGFEASMGIDRSRPIPEALDRETRSALRGVHLYHSGGEVFYYQPIREGIRLYSSKWVQNVEGKVSRFGGRSAIVTNGFSFWNDAKSVTIAGIDWFVHVERREVGSGEVEKGVSPKDGPAFYTDEQLAQIDAAYEAEYVRGADTLFIEDVAVGQVLPKMVKGPLTITDMIDAYMGAGWFSYGSWPYRIAWQNRKVMPGFYTKNEFNAWDTLQRLHWDGQLARAVGVPATYDIGPMRKAMLAHYCTNFAGDDGWVYRLRYEFRSFNYMGDTTWIEGTVSDARVDETLGPLIELKLCGINQRGQENMCGTATILIASRKHGLARLPPVPPLPQYRAPD